ncbi:unnamed protein product, partial [Rotaria sordida]
IFTIFCYEQALNVSQLLSPLISFMSSTIAIVLSKLFVLFFSTNYFLNNV